jgi:hypothetical protein
MGIVHEIVFVGTFNLGNEGRLDVARASFAIDFG